MPDELTLGQTIKNARRSRYMSLRQLAAEAGIHFSYLSKLENDKLPSPRPEVLYRLADVLEIPRQEFMTIARRVPGETEKQFKRMKAGEFGELIKKLRLKKGLSQAKLAINSGIHYSYISKIEAKKIAPPSRKIITRLAAALGVDPEDLNVRAGKADISSQVLLNYHRIKSQRRSSMENILRKPLNLARLGLALVLVVAFSVALWAASPKPAKAITVSVTNGATATVGQAYTFTVTINVAAADKLPLRAVDVRIQSTTNPGAYSTFLTGLPIPSTSTTFGPTSVGTASVSGSTSADWGSGTGSRSGTGFGYIAGGSTTINGTGLGYGYGTSPYTGVAASITYTITWTPPANWPTSNTYKILVLAYLTAGDANSAFTHATTNTFTLAAAAPPPAGGAPSGAPAPGTLTYNPTTGRTTVGTTVTATSGQASVTIPAGTLATVNGLPVAQIIVSSEDVAPLAPNYLFDANGILLDAYVPAYSVNLGPTGAQFDPPVTVTLKVPAGVDPATVTLAIWNVDHWVVLDNVVYDPATGTISGATSHFTLFAVLTPAPAPVTVTVTPTATPTPTPTQTPTTPKPPVIVPPTPVVTTVTIPGPSVSSTVILPSGTGPGGAAEGTNWLWPIVIGVIGVIAMIFVVRYGWNLRRD